MDQILVVYEGMQDAAGKYTGWASDIRDLCSTIKSRNTQLVSSEWNGQAAVAFEERFSSDHAVAMGKVADALDEISSFITNYIANQQSADQSQAGAIS